MGRKIDSSTGNTFGEEFAAQRRSGAKTFMWNGTEYGTQLAAPKKGRTLGNAPTNPRDDETGMSRGSRPNYGAGRGSQGGPTLRQVKDQQADDYQAADDAATAAASNYGNEGRANQQVRADDADKAAADSMGSVYKKGGRVTGYRGYGKAKKV